MSKDIAKTLLSNFNKPDKKLLNTFNYLLNRLVFQGHVIQNLHF